MWKKIVPEFICRSRGLEISFDLEEHKENVESVDMIKHIQTKVEEMDVGLFLICFWFWIQFLMNS